MGVKIQEHKKCNVLGCNLFYNHAGMHFVQILSDTRSAKKRHKSMCHEVNTKHEVNNKHEVKTKHEVHTKFASVRESPSKDRVEEQISTDHIQRELIKSRLIFLQKSINDLLKCL